MRTHSRRRASSLGLAVITAALLAGSTEARAEGARRGVERYPPRSGLLVPWSAPSAQPAWAIDVSRHTAAELRLSRSLERGARAAARRGPLNAPLEVMGYGVQSEPFVQFQMKRELLGLLARMTGDGRILRAAMSLRPGFSLRGVVESVLLERARARATYLEIEDWLVPNGLVTSSSSRAAFATSGALLFGSGIAAQRLLHGALGYSFTLYPQPWPLGVRIMGSFHSP